jgi:hypothetical protein
MERKASGLNLLQVMALILGLGSLSALISPFLTRKIFERKLATAAAETAQIRDAIVALRSDTGRWPTNGPKGEPDAVRCLCSGTAVPTGNPLTGSHPFWTALSEAGDLMDAHLGVNSRGYAMAGDLAWSGPYGPPMNLDPWGRPYLANVEACTSKDPELHRKCWVISAGPNGSLETNGLARATDEIAGDDIGALVFQR